MSLEKKNECYNGVFSDSYSSLIFNESLKLVHCCLVDFIATDYCLTS